MSVIPILSTLFNKCQIKDMIGTSSLKLHGCQTGLIFITFPALWYHNIAAADTGDILDILTFGPRPSRGDTARCYQHSDGDCCRRCAPRVSAARGSAGRRVQICQDRIGPNLGCVTCSLLAPGEDIFTRGKQQMGQYINTIQKRQTLNIFCLEQEIKIKNTHKYYSFKFKHIFDGEYPPLV